MNEKTKQILRYVACGFCGLALGIGLLGGLSMCATSSKKTTGGVNTILAKRPKGRQYTTEGGYTAYSFTFRSMEGDLQNSRYIARIWEVDTSDYSLNLISTTNNTMADGFSAFESVVNSVYDSAFPSSNVLRFIAVEGRNVWGGTNINYWSYFSFVGSHNPQMVQRPFILKTPLTKYHYHLSGGGYSSSATDDLYILNSEKSGTFLGSPNYIDPTTDLTFQDAPSYYREQGYQDGYSAGHTAGYSEGYDDAYAEKDTGIAFTSCGVYPNAQVTLATDETIGNFKYMYLCHYITKPGYDEHTIYIMWTTNANTGQYLGEVIDRNDTDSYDPAVTLGSFTQQATSSVTITATEDMEFGLWVGYITTFHNRGEITNSILWFQGGTSESDMQIYQNGYDEGYQNGNQAGQETGYEQGYERGQEVGDAEGYSRGYTEGFNQTNTKNVFSLFTSAFDSVASFFDLKIFGFLPLYWFFLAPLFIALISLLMRMVKH